MAKKLGEMGDEIYDLNAEIAKANEVVKQLDNKKRDLENELLLRMQDAGTDIVRGNKATISISETVRPQIQDFDAFATFAIRKKALHMFEKRISGAAYQEMKKLLGGKPIPGLTEFTSVRLNVRKASA